MAVRYYQADALGSVIALTDETGIIRTQYAYDPFGNVTITGEASDNPFQYTGRENDGTGLYYYRARYYSPELQRFISEDPIGIEGGINLYVYVKDRPTMFVDPLGLQPLQGFQPPLPRLPLPPEPPEVPGAEEPPRGHGCEVEFERVCDDYRCKGEPVKDKCIVKDVNECYCLHYCIQKVLNCAGYKYHIFGDCRE